MTAPKSTLTDAELAKIARTVFESFPYLKPVAGHADLDAALIRAGYAKGYEAGSAPREPTQKWCECSANHPAHGAHHSANCSRRVAFDAAREGK